MSREYKKRNKEYWESRSNPPKQGITLFKGETAYASSVGGSDVTPQRVNRNFSNKTSVSNRFKFLDSGILPYVSGDENGNINCSEAIELSQKAWANIPIVRNTIETQVEFSNTKIKLRAKNKKLKAFFQEWLKIIDVESLADVFYREIFRSGNVFLYKIRGNVNEEVDDYLRAESYKVSLKNRKIPIKYQLLNPTYISALGDYAGNYSYSKILTAPEIRRLRNSRDAKSKLILKDLGLSEDKNSFSVSSRYLMPLDGERLIPILYQKQDYEPFSIPPLWPILDDIELKLIFKYADKITAQTVEQIILKVTAGAEPDKGGVDPNVMKTLEGIFAEDKVRRTLVADYTTKAEFIIPDLNKVLGSSKYEAVNRDIREGLQSLVSSGQEKFSNQMAQIKVFLQRLKGARRKFKSFLESEMKMIAKDLGLQGAPEIVFEEIDLKDEVQMLRAYNRLIELGVLTGQDALEVYKDGILPSKEENLESQREYLKHRKEGLFLPQMQSVNDRSGNDAKNQKTHTLTEGRPDGTGHEKDNKDPERVMASNEDEEKPISAKALAEVTNRYFELVEASKALAKKKYKRKKLNKDQISVCESLVANIVSTNPYDKWEEQLHSFYEKGDLNIDNEVSNAITKTEIDLEILNRDAALVYHSKCI